MKFTAPNPILSTQTLCYVMLCYVMLRDVILCYVMLCDVMLCFVMLDTRQADNDISNVTNKYVNLRQFEIF